MILAGYPLILVFVLCGAGALLGTMIPQRHNPMLTAVVGSLAAASALWAGTIVLESGGFRCLLWTIRSVGTLGVSLDRLSALFLVVAAVVVLASSVFSASYLKRYVGMYSLRAFNAGFLLLIASIVWILIADDILGFLLAWEAMSILSYLLVNFEHRHPGTSRAAYLMLATGEAGFVAVEIVLLFLAARTGSFGFSTIKVAAIGLPPAARWAVFLLTFFGFATKVGLVPLNSWLPQAHPAAPANVSSVLSGTILNLGLYGIVRVNFDLMPGGTVGTGVVMLGVGTISALVGILYATTEGDLKGLLAHSSIENMGIITIGLGAGAIFAASQQPVFAGMAFVAAFYHLVNHSLYKALLFLGAGAVDQSAGTRDLNRLGGLMRLMPYTTGTFLVGALAISALPPFNGFVSEWLTLETLLRSAELPSTVLRLVFALCGAGLALTAALAVTCFVKAFAMGFLGLSRSESASKAVEAHNSQIVPMAMLAVLCLLLGILPTYVIPMLDRDLEPMIDARTTEALVPPFFVSGLANQQLPPTFVADFRNLGAQVGRGVLPGRGLVLLHRGSTENPVVFAMSSSYSCVALSILLFILWFVVKRATRKRSVARKELWAGGIHKLLPEMTYTATGFSNPVRVVFDAIFRADVVEDMRQTVAVHFRTAIRRRREDTYLVDRLFFRPIGGVLLWVASRFAGMHHGRLNAYVAYALGFLIAMLVLCWLP